MMAVKKKNKILILLILASHLVCFGLHDLIHDHPILITGSLEARFFPHEDADHCKHIPLSEHCECSICLSAHSRIAPDQISLDFGKVQVVGAVPTLHFRILFKIISLIPSPVAVLLLFLANLFFYTQRDIERIKKIPLFCSESPFCLKGGKRGIDN